ncbi:MAG: hypothetical protein H7Z40_02095 [Phycisphaerae bacterium]|nr:hypothetical protein [Gemmatimonadaceae bacterium]
MEFVIVVYPTERDVFVGGGPLGKTGKKLKLQTGTHTFDLDVPLDYAPAAQTIPVSGTTKLDPLLVVFTPKPVMRAGVRRGGKKITKRAGRKTAKTAKAGKTAKTAKTAKKSVKRAKKAAKPAVKKRTNNPTKKAGKTTAKKAAKKTVRNTASKSPRKAAAKHAKRTARKSRD